MADSRYVPDDEDILEKLNDSHYITSAEQLESILGRSAAKEAREITPEVVFRGRIHFAPEEVHPHGTLDNFYSHYAAEWVTSDSEDKRYAAALMGGENEWEALMDDSSTTVRVAVAQAANEEIQLEMAQKDDAIIREALSIYGNDKVRVAVAYLELQKEIYNTDVVGMAVQNFDDPKVPDIIMNEFWREPEKLAFMASRCEPSRDTLIRLSSHESAAVRTAAGYAAADAGFEDIVKTITASEISEFDRVNILDTLEMTLEEKAEKIEEPPETEQRPIQSPAPALKPERVVLTAETTEERVSELTGKVDSTFDKLVSSGHFGDIITTMAKFPRYSLENAILITAQAPQATQLLESKTWDSKYQKRIKKGEKSIKVLAPAKKKGRNENEPQCRVVSMFDAAQLQGGAPEIEPKKQLSDTQLDGLIDRLTKAAPFEVRLDTLGDDKLAEFNAQDNTITFNNAADKQDIAKAIISNIVNKSPSLAAEKDLVVFTAKSSSITALACAELGLDVPSQNLADLKYLSAYSPEETRQILNDIRTESKAFVADILGGKTADKAAPAKTQEKAVTEPEPPPAPKEATAEITKSENKNFTKGEKTDFAAANSRVKSADDEIAAKLEVSENKDVQNERIEYTLEFEVNGEQFIYNAQQDLGSGDGSIIEHIKAYHEYCLNSPAWRQHIIDTKGEAAWEQESALSKKVLDTVVPYLEREVQEKSKENEAPSKADPEPLDIESIPPIEFEPSTEPKTLKSTPIREQLTNARQKSAVPNMQAPVRQSQPAPEL